MQKKGECMSRLIRIEDEIFEMFPDFYRGIIVVEEITNHPSLKRVKRLLKSEIDKQAGNDFENDERLIAWKEVHKRFGSNPNKYPPSILSLMKRINKNPALPYINTVVALFNYISLKYCLPCGGDDCGTIGGDFVLGLADGTENFLPLGAEKSESLEKGEVIYFDGDLRNVMCRRWNWRNGDTTKIETTTCRLIINIDCIPPSSADLADQARDELAELLQLHCGAVLCTDCLYAARRKVEVSV